MLQKTDDVNKEGEYKTFSVDKCKCIIQGVQKGGNREESVEPEQHFSRIAALTADSRMSH
jgi:hypothetical protein